MIPIIEHRPLGSRPINRAQGAVNLAPTTHRITRGKGFVRIGGTNGETRNVTAGDAVLWPANLDHKVWTEDESLDAIVIDGPAEREQ